MHIDRETVRKSPTGPSATGYPFSEPFCGSPEIWQQAVAKDEEVDLTPWVGMDRELAESLAEVLWSHNKFIFYVIADKQTTRRYFQQTLEIGQSREVLVLQIRSDLYAKVGQAVTNFPNTLPPMHLDRAQQTLKCPYAFDLMTMTAPDNERNIENQFIRHITQFLLELGQGFAFSGRQYHLKVGGNPARQTQKCSANSERDRKRFAAVSGGQ